LGLSSFTTVILAPQLTAADGDQRGVPGPGGGGSGDLIVGFIVGQTHFKFNKSIKLYGVKLLDI
jgi:hypothetical protein